MADVSQLFYVSCNDIYFRAALEKNLLSTANQLLSEYKWNDKL